MSGSSEEKSLLIKQQKLNAKRAAEHEEAERKRIKNAAERKRLALIEKQKTDALQTRLANERAVARQIAQAKQSAAQSAFRRSVTGTWNPVGSMIDRNNNVYSNGRDKVAISYRFTIPQIKYDKFVVPITVYASEYPTGQFTTDATVTLDAGSNKISLIFSGNKHLKMACITKPERECTYYTSLGEAWTGIVKNGEIKLVGGRKRNITLRRQ